jgi:teichuronic acid biosynthesis glycosyltransferase TuaH
MIAIDRCPACQSHEASSVFARGDGLPLARCRSCELLFVRAYPKRLTEAYEATYFDGTGYAQGLGYKNYLGSIAPIDFARHMATLEAARLAAGGERRRLLDIGAATGDFLAMARLLGWDDSEGVELSEFARRASRALGVTESYATLDDVPPSASFGFITAWELVEHLPDLGSFLHRLRTHLDDPGVFICSTPDAGQTRFYPRPEEWLGFHVSLEHVSYFTERALRHLLEKWFAHVEIWSWPTQMFYHQLFGVGFTRRPSAEAIRRIQSFQRLEAEAAVAESGAPAWPVAVALAQAHPAPEWTVRLRRNYPSLALALDGARSPEADLVLALVAKSSGDALRARQAMARFLAAVPRRVIPAGMLEPFVPGGGRADRLVLVLRRVAEHARHPTGFVREVAARAVNRLPRPLWTRRLRAIVQSAAARGVVVYPSSVSYSFLRQRPHQLGRALAERGYLFFFCTTDPRDGAPGFRRLAPNFYLCSAPLEVFQAVDHPIVLITRPAGWRRLVQRISAGGGARIVYDWIDDLAVFGPVENQVEEHLELLDRAEVVTTSASLLFAEARRRRPDVLLLPNAVRLEDFADGPEDANRVPEKLKEVVAKRQPIIGYYGSISSWMDFDLLARVLILNPDKVFVTVGPLWPLHADDRDRLANLRRAPNIICVDHVDYSNVKNYLRWFDVAIVPFRLSDLTHATSPVKLFEYMAAAKPIVATGMLECKKYRSVLWGTTPEEFSERVAEGLRLRDDPRYLAIIKEEASLNTWAQRARGLDCALSRLHRCDIGGALRGRRVLDRNARS